MPSRKALVKQLFKQMGGDLARIRPEAAAKVVCPLCMRPFVLETTSKRRPSAEHLPQSSLGGTLQFSTLTCIECNNTHGCRLEAHLSKAMHALDFMNGRGTIPCVIQNNVGHVAANLDWNMAEPVKVNVLGERASNTAAVAALPSLIRPDAKITFTLNFGFIPESYWRAILRVAYLVAFARFGYSYVFSEGGAQVRRVLEGGPLPNDVILEAYPSADPGVPFLAHAFEDGILVLFRVRSLMTRWISVLLPGITGCAWDLLGRVSPVADRLRLLVEPGNGAPNIVVRFGQEPVKQLKELKFP